MAEQENIFSKYLDENQPTFNTNIEQQKKTFDSLVESKQQELGLKSEEKINDFVSQNISLEEGFDADTLYNIGRLGTKDGYSFDAYETAKYDPITKALQPYLGSVAPKDGSKRSKKWDLHRTAFAKKYGLPSKEYVTQDMLNQEGARQAEEFKKLLYEGQDSSSKSVNVDIRQDGTGYFGRPLITVRNPVTGKIINEVMNTPENNAMFTSEYNRNAWIKDVQELNALETQANVRAGQGFVDSALKQLSSGVDNLQATAYGMGALIADAIPGKVGQDTADWFIKNYLKNLEEARINGANLLSVDQLDWNNPKAVWSKMGASIGEAMPSFALMFGTGGLGGWIAKKTAQNKVKKEFGTILGSDAAKVISSAQKKGRAGGAFLAAEVMEVGGIYGDVAAEGNRSYRDIGLALAGGTASASLEFILPTKIMNKYGLGKNAKKVARKQLGKNSVRQNLTNIGKSMLGGALTEGTTEAFQQVIQETTQEYIKEGILPEYKSEEFVRSVIDAFAAGFLPGGAISGTGSTISAASNFIQGDKGAIQSNINEVQQDARDAINQEADGDSDVQSQKDLNTTNNEIEKQRQTLNLELSKEYDSKSPIEKSLELLEALNILEIGQKALPKDKRNVEVTNARKSIEKSLKNLNAGSSVIKRARDIALIQAKRLKRIANAKNDEQKALINQEAKLAIEVIRNKDKRYDKAGIKVIVKSIDDTIKTLNKVTAKLKDPNLSKKQRKRLTREQNLLGIKIDTLSKDPAGVRLPLESEVFKNIDTALNSFEFKNRKSNIRENVEPIKEELQAVESITKTSKKVLEILNKKDASPKERLDALNAFLRDYKNIENARDRVRVALGEATDPNEEKLLRKTEKAYSKKLEAVNDAFNAVMDAEVEVPTNVNTLNKAKKVLYSLFPINKKLQEQLTKLSEQLSPEEKALLAAHIELYDAKKAIDGNKDIQQVRDDVLLGDEEFQGFMNYLKLAQEGKNPLSDIQYFVKALKDKLAAFEKAQEIRKNKGLRKVWINKKDYSQIITKEPQIEDTNGNLIEDTDNYFFVVEKSDKLITAIGLEISFGEAITEIIIQNKKAAPKRSEDVAAQKELEESINEFNENKQRTTKSTTELDDIDTENIEIDKKEEPKTETAKPKEKTQDSTEESAAAATKPKKIRYKVKHFLNTFKDSFPSLFKTGLTAFEIFNISNPKRESFYSVNTDNSLIDDKGKSKVPELLNKLGVTDPKFIEYLDTYFLEFKKAFEEVLLVEPNKDAFGNIYAKRELLNLLASDSTGKMPDEVIFAMMMSSLDWISINKYNSEVTDEQSIGLLLYQDRKAPITREEFKEFGNMGILWRHAASEVGGNVLNNLNIKVDTSEFQGLKLDELIAKFAELEKGKSDGVIRDKDLTKKLEIAVGGMALAIAATVHPNKDTVTKDSKETIDFDGILQISHVDFHHPTYKEDNKPSSEKNPDGSTRWIRTMKVIKFPYLQETDVLFDLDKLFESFRNNKENIDLINGIGSSMSQPLTQESKTFQEFVRDSFIKLPNKTINLIKKLQSVEWAGKQEALKLFELVDTDKDTMDRLINMINLEESHKEEFEGDETSNKDKEKDLQQIRDFLNAGSKPFWYRYKAQKQNRLRIDSNGINGQRSKLHRALFMPKSANVLIDSAFSRALYQLGIAQALGYPIDKNDLPGAMAAFEKMYVQTLPLVNLIKKGNVNSKEFNKLLNQLLDNKEIEIEPSMHVLEAIASLANYDPDNAFKTASLGIETDGITNGYAIAQMQLKGVPSRILKMPKGEERDLEIVNHLTKSFAQIGVMIGTNEDGSPRTMEGFIKDGELDVYQALAKVIRDTLNKPSAIDEINALKGRIYGPRLKEKHIKAIDTIHGEIWDKTKEKISSFGRNLAKNPLMISGYGAEIERIISALAEDIVPTTHKKLAEFQVKRDKAKTPEEIKAVRKEFNNYLRELDLFKPGIKTNIKNHLAEGKSLKEYTLSESEQIRLKSSFRRMFEPSVTAALNEFTTPLKNARDAIIKSGEIQFITFMYKFEEALAQYRTDVGLKPNANVSRSVREGIAEELALKHMPLVYGPWSQQSPLQIIKTKLNTKNKDEARVNIVFNGKQSVRHFAKNGYKFIPVKEDDGVIRRESITSNAYSRTYVEPSVSMYSNTIQNIDSVIIGEAMAKNPEVLGIFDALMSNITDSFDNNTIYNESFRKVSRDFSIIENALKRLVEVKEGLTDTEIKEIDKRYRKNSFEGKNLQKRIDLTRNAKQKQNLEAQKTGLGFKNIESLFETEIERITEINKLLNKYLGEGWLDRAVISQMYMPESLTKLEGYNKKAETTLDEVLKDDDIVNDITEESLVLIEKVKSVARKNLGTKIAPGRGDISKDTLDPIKKNFGEDYVRYYIAEIFEQAMQNVANSDKDAETKIKYTEALISQAEQLVLSYFGISETQQLINAGKAKESSTKSGVTKVKGLFKNLKFEDVEKAIKRDEKASKRFSWISTWYGPVDYEYSGIKHEAQEMSPGFDKLARKLEKRLGHPKGYFNSALVNLFPTGKGISKHADDEFIYIRTDETIGSVATVSLGGSSEITISRNDRTEKDETFNVENGDLYVMPDGSFQREYKHAVGKSTGPRISMTFRHIPRSQLKEKGPTEKEVETTADSYELPFVDTDTGKLAKTTASQTTAINSMKNWMNNTRNRIFVLAGRGGTGKTTIVERAIEEFEYKAKDKFTRKTVGPNLKLKDSLHKVRFALPTHKAKKVIMEAAGKFDEGQFGTIDQILGYVGEWNSIIEGFDFVKNQTLADNVKTKLREEEVELLIIDEASMVNEQKTIELFELAKDLDIRILFMGDDVQLPPVEPDAEPGTILLSVAFDNFFKLGRKFNLELDLKTDVAELTERKRQKNESPILGITDIIANVISSIQRGDPKKYNGSSNNSGFILPKIKNSKDVKYEDSTLENGPSDKTLKEFKKDYDANPRGTKYLHFNKEGHKRSKVLHKRFRKILFPNELNAEDLIKLPFIEGERITLGGSVNVLSAMGDFVSLSRNLNNGDEVTVTKRLEKKLVSYEEVYYIDGEKQTKSYRGIPVNVLEVVADDNQTHTLVFPDNDSNALEVIAGIAPNSPNRKMSDRQLTSLRTDEFTGEQERVKTMWAAKKILASISTSPTTPAYVINTHKAQGSSYGNAYVDYTNIMSDAGSPDWLTKLKALYVATSRPRDKLVLVGDGNFSFGSLDKQLDENRQILDILQKDSDTEKRQSLDNEIDTELANIWDTNSLKTTAQNIFNKLAGHFDNYYPNNEEKTNQQSHLQRVLNEIILPTGEALNNVTVELLSGDIQATGAVEIGANNQRVQVILNNKKPKSFSEQTAQEVYLHELIHVLTVSPIASNTVFRKNVRNIRNSVKKELEKMDRPYEMFLHKDNKGNIITLTDAKTEIQRAKQQYNYLFGSTTPSQFILDEFLAYALTNKHLVRQLSSMPAKVVPLWNKESKADVIEKIIDLFSELLNRFKDAITNKNKSQTLDQEIFNLTKDMVTISHSKASKIRSIIQKQEFAKQYDNANDAASEFLKDAASKGLTQISDAYIKGVDKLTKDGKIDNFLANILYDTKLVALMTSSYGKFIKKNPKLQRSLDKAFQNFKPGLRHNMASFKADVVGGVPQDFIKLVYKSQKEVDQARSQYKKLTQDSLLNEFKDLDSLTDNERQALTRVLLKSDFSILESTGAYSIRDAIKLLNDDEFLKEQVDKYAEILNIKNNKHYAAQTEALAEFMMIGNQYNHNTFKNAHVIHQKNKNKSTATVDDIDVYITLLALQKHVEPQSKLDAKSVINREFALNKDENGITNLIYHHISFKETSKKEGFNDNPALMTKGYIATITDPTIHIEFDSTDEKTKKQREKDGYEFISGFETISGVGNSDYGMYIINNLPDAIRTKGIASVTSKKAAGTSFKEIISRNPKSEGQIDLLFRKWLKTQTGKENTSDKNHTMMPIINEKGEIVDYSIHMNHALVESLLKQELSFDQVMPTMFSHQQDKISSQKINEEAIDLLYDHSQINYKKSPQKYVNILEGKYKAEYFDVLPVHTRNYIRYIANLNEGKGRRAFYVEHKLLDVVFGYKMPSIGNAPFIKNNAQFSRRMKVLEKAIFELVALAKVNIVIKIPAVLGFNILSNFTTSFLYGVPPTYIAKKWIEGYKELQRYQKDAEKLKLLELKQIGNPNLKNNDKLNLKKKELTDELNNNKVAKFIDMGLFNSITEDINKNDFTYRNKSMNTLKNSKVGKKFNNLFKGNVVKVANQAYMGEETAFFKTMMHATQASDFIARYAMYKHSTEIKGMNEDKAYKQMVETFVNYDQPLNKYLQYGNDIGLLFFIKYYFRIQRATINLAIDKPLNIALLFIANGMLGFDFESIMESSVLAGNFFPTGGGPIKVLDEVGLFGGLPGLEVLSGESLGIG